MPRLTYRDLRSLTKVLRDLYDCPDLDTFPARMLSLLRQLVPAEIVAYNEVNLSAGQFRPVVDPPGLWPANGDQLFRQYMREHPLITYYHRTGNGHTVKISDFLSRRQLLRLGLYNELYRPLGVETQIAFGISTAPGREMVGIALTRGRSDFSERDRLLLDLLRPHAIQAYRNAAAMTRVQHELTRLRHVLEESAQGAVVLDQSGAVRMMTEPGWWWLRTYFAEGPCQGDQQLPETLRQWFATQRSQLVSGGDALPARTPLVIEQDRARLVARLLPGRVEGEWLVLLDEQRKTFSAQSLETFGLTRREAEVLFWVAQGKTNPEVATILGITSRTVHKHLERIYPKLGVETRTAATLQVLEALGLLRR
jgi:DNA-binding CsgD family transcriptional regulator